MPSRLSRLCRLVLLPIAVLAASLALVTAAQAIGTLDQSSNTKSLQPGRDGFPRDPGRLPATQDFIPTTDTLTAIEVLLDNRTGAVGYGINFGWGPGVPATGRVSILDAANQVITGPTTVVVAPLPDVPGQCEWMATSPPAIRERASPDQPAAPGPLPASTTTSLASECLA